MLYVLSLSPSLSPFVAFFRAQMILCCFARVFICYVNSYRDYNACCSRFTVARMHEICTKLLQIHICASSRSALNSHRKNDIIFFCFTCEIFYQCTMKREIWTLNTYKKHIHAAKFTRTQRELEKMSQKDSIKMNITEVCVQFFHFLSRSLSLCPGWMINQYDGIAARKKEVKNDFNSLRAKVKCCSFHVCAFIHVFGLSFVVCVSDCFEFFCCM